MSYSLKFILEEKISFMKSIFLVFIFCFTTNFYAQNNVDIYRVEQRMESPSVGTYNVSILMLKEEGKYEIFHQEYPSKKMMKKNVILHLEKEEGKWERKGDKIHLINSEGKVISKFFVKRKNQIALIIDDSEVSDLNWVKIN